MFNAEATAEEIPCSGCISEGNTRYNETVSFPDIPPGIFTGRHEDLKQHTLTRIDRPDTTETREITISNIISCAEVGQVITSRECFVVNCQR